MRYTPAGLPALDLALRHESEVVEDGQPRRVALDVRARAIGEIAHRLAGVELGSEHGFAGFLNGQRNGRGVVFHVVEVDAAP